MVIWACWMCSRSLDALAGVGREKEWARDTKRMARDSLRQTLTDPLTGRVVIGRPQFDTSGEGIIITSHDKLAHYLGMLTHQVGGRSVGVGFVAGAG